MLSENLDKEILWVDDENNLMELTLKTLLSNKKGSICLTNNPRELWDKDQNARKKNNGSKNKEVSAAVLFTKHDARDNENDFLNLSSNIEAIPLLMLVGPSEDMKKIMKDAMGMYGCFKEIVNFDDFLKKMWEFSMYWVYIDTTDQIKRK